MQVQRIQPKKHKHTNKTQSKEQNRSLPQHQKENTDKFSQTHTTQSLWEPRPTNHAPLLRQPHGENFSLTSKPQGQWFPRSKPVI